MKAAAYKVVAGATQAQVVQPTYPRPCPPPLRTRAQPLARATLELAVEAGRGVEAVVVEVDDPAISSPSISRLVCTGSHNPSRRHTCPNTPSIFHLALFRAVFVRPGPPSSPFKRGLLTSSPCSSAEAASPATVNPRGLQFTPMPAMAEVRSPDMLHPQDGPCDCLQVNSTHIGFFKKIVNVSYLSALLQHGGADK